MAVGEYLPPVVTRLSMDIGDFADGILKAKALIKTLQSKVDIPVTANTDAAVAKLATLKSSLKDVTSAQGDFASAVRDSNTALLYQSAAIDAANSSMSSMSRRLTTAANRQDALKNSVQDANGALMRQAGLMGGVTAGALVGAGRGGGGFGGAWWANPTVWHWIISGGAEILAVTIPALIALGAAGAVAIEGTNNAFNHLQASYTASEASMQMYGKTFGSQIGLARGQLQKMQTAADPSIYGILGSAIMTVNEHFGSLAETGLKVIQIMQTFSAKVVTDFAPGGALGGATDTLLAHMTSDLQGIGKVFGNLGSSLLLFGSQMPGLAEILLKTFANITGWVTELIALSSKFRFHGISVLTAVMAYEEFNRWGGLVAVMLGKLGLASNVANGGLARGVFSFARFDGILRGIWSVIPNVIGALGSLVTKLGATGAGAAIGNFADKIGMGISSLGAFQLALVTLAAVGLGILIDKFVTARTAVQQFGDELQKKVLAAPNVNSLQLISQNIGQIQQKLQEASTTAGLDKLNAGWSNVGRTFSSVNADARADVNDWKKSVDDLTSGHFNSAITSMGRGLLGLFVPGQGKKNAIGDLHSALQQQQNDLNNVAIGAAYLADTYHTTFEGALGLADLANVKLVNGITGTGQAAVIARAQIASLVMGYRAVGQSSGEVGADMTALAIQTGIADTQVSKLNSAWDSIMQNMTGGTTGLGGFVQSIKNMGTVVGSAKNNLGQAANINLTTGQFANALTNFGQVGSQAWQNFGQVVGSTAPQLIDWLRTAGAVGAIAAPQFRTAVLGMVSSLTAFAQKSPAARAQLIDLAQEADPNIKTWGQLNTAIKNGNISIGDTTKAVEQATVKMGNMAQVAQNLGQVLQSAVISAMSSAEISASGVTKAMQAYDQTIMNGTQDTKAGQSARSQLIKDLENLGYTAQKAQQLLEIMQGQINSLHGKTVTVTTIMQAVNGGGPVGPLAHGYGVPSTAAGVRRGFASGTSGASRGWGWVGEAGPELVKFSGGERVIPSHVAAMRVVLAAKTLYMR